MMKVIVLEGVPGTPEVWLARLGSSINVRH